MDENEKLELDLEDIMKEFSTEEGETPDEEIREWTQQVFGDGNEMPKVTPAVPAASEEPTQRFDIVSEPTIRMEPVEATPKTPDVTGDTIRLDTTKIRERTTPVTADTIRLDTAAVAKATVRNAQRILDEEETENEPFSEKWEPEYEQPMGEYRPAQQIITHPRSRLKELKKKLVAGPEKRYYDLSEIGFGKLQAAIFFNVLVVLISGASTAIYTVGLIQPERMKLLIFGQLLAMLLSALFGSNQLIEGVAHLFRKRFSLSTLLTITFIVCFADGVFCLWQERVPCCAAFSLLMTMSLWSSYQRRYTEMGQMDTLRKATHLESVVAAPDYYDGKTGFLRGQGEVEDFMDNYQTLPAPEKRLDIYALVALILSFATGVTAGVLNGLRGDLMAGISAGIQVFAVTLLAAVPVTSFVAVSRPMAILERRLHNIGTVLCGWQGVEGMKGKAVFPVSFTDLFPAGSCRMNGVKFFGSREPDEIVSYCTAVIEAENGGLAPLFSQVLDSRNAIRYDATDLVRYDGGLGGVVEGETVLVGSLSFMKSMNVETPKDIRVSQAVCVAIDGEFCGLFALSMDRFRGATFGIATLCGHSKLSAVLTSGDFMLTKSFICSKHKVSPKRLEIPDQETRQALAEVETPENAKSLALITGESLMSYAYAVTGARCLRSCTKAGTVVSMIGGSLGIAMMLALTILGALQYLTPANMFLYQLIWLIPGLLITEGTRNI